MPIPATVLVVDDPPCVRKILCSLLAEQSHWKIYEAENGTVALDRIRELKPHVVVMDVVMPGKSGIEAAYEIRQMGFGTKVILISSYYAALLERHFCDGGFLEKSDIARDLIPAVTRLLPQESQAPPA